LIYRCMDDKSVEAMLFLAVAHRYEEV